MLLQNCLLKHIVEGSMEGRTEVKERRGRRRKQLQDDFFFKEKRSYRKLKEEAPKLHSVETSLWKKI